MTYEHRKYGKRTFDKMERAFKEEVDEFHDKYAGDIEQICKACQGITKAWHWGGPNGYVDHINLSEELGNVLKRVNYDTPGRIGRWVSHPDAEYPDYVYRSPGEFMDFVVSTLRHEVTAIADRTKGALDGLSPIELARVEAYHVLTEKLLPAWKTNDYLADIDKMGIKIVKNRSFASKQKEIADQPLAAEHTGHLAELLEKLPRGSEYLKEAEARATESPAVDPSQKREGSPFKSFKNRVIDTSHVTGVKGVSGDTLVGGNAEVFGKPRNFEGMVMLTSAGLTQVRRSAKQAPDGGGSGAGGGKPDKGTGR